MPQRDHHTGSIEPAQVDLTLDEQWEKLVQERLPARLQEQARALGAFERVRSVERASDLLRANLSYVLNHCSLKELGLWSWLSGSSSNLLSSQAWHKRVRQSAPWLLWLFNELLAAPTSQRSWPAKRVLLVDATHVSCQGRKGETWRWHCAYDLLVGRLAWVQVSDKHVGESLGLVPAQAGDLLIGDGAYSRAKPLLKVANGHAHSLVRYSPAHLPLYAVGAPKADREHQLPIADWLGSLVPGLYQRYANVVCEGRVLLVRLVVQVLPEEQAEDLRRQKQRQARDKGRELSAEALFFAGFVMLLTTLPELHWSAKLVLDLYRCRWQVEVLFKRIKQVLSMHTLRCRSSETAQAMIAALLVAWLLIEDDVEALRRQISDAEPSECPLSSWRLAQVAFRCLQKITEGDWDPRRIWALGPALRCWLQEHRQRPLREQQRRLQLRSKLGIDPDLVVVFSCSSA